MDLDLDIEEIEFSADLPEESYDSEYDEAEEGKGSGKIKKEKKENPVLEWVKVIAIAVAVALVINFVVIINSTVPTGSMEDTIQAGSRVIGLRVVYWFTEPQRGDIVVFKNPDNTSQLYIKRIIGEPGDTVEIKKGVTYINGEALDEPYLRETPAAEDFGPYNVPEGHYFAMGDNRNSSLDGRYWNNKYIPRDYILGKAGLCYWPLDRIGVLK
ncbi:MAG: signal peptidase I [Parasporobacterium sp.]|nr:signal peptidase I [Parasporobacterium sp.]